MKKTVLFGIVAFLLMQVSCITDKNKYKETDVFEEYEAQSGFTILHLPPILFKIVLSASDEANYNSKELLDKIEVIKVMFFEEKENTQRISELKASMSKKITDFEYVLLTRIAQENNDISIYVIEKENVIREVLITSVTEKEFIGLNLIGNLSKDEIMKVYKSINLQNLQDYKN